MTRIFTVRLVRGRHATLLIALLSCAPYPQASPPTPPREPIAERWDGSLLFSSRERELVWVGPVLRGFLPESSGGVRAAVSERCRLLAVGIPYKRAPIEREMRDFVRATGWTAATWALDDAGHATACSDALGATFSLPTADQARAVLEYLVPPQQSRVIWIRDKAGRIVTLRLARGAEGARLERVQSTSAPMYCVAAASRLPPLEPGDEEIRSCARRARAEAELIDPEMIGHFLDDQEVEQALARRAARKHL